MKKTIFAALLICSLFNTATAQKVTRDAAGNYTLTNQARDTSNGKPTGNTATDTDGKIYPVYEGSRGGRYFLRVSKNGNLVKKYLPKNS